MTGASEAVAYLDEVEARSLLLPVLLKGSGIVDVVFTITEEVEETGLLSLTSDEGTGPPEDVPLGTADEVPVEDTVVALLLPDNDELVVVSVTGSSDSVISPAEDDEDDDDDGDIVMLEVKEPDAVPFPLLMDVAVRLDVLPVKATEDDLDDTLGGFEGEPLLEAVPVVAGAVEEELAVSWVDLLLPDATEPVREEVVLTGPPLVLARSDSVADADELAELGTELDNNESTTLDDDDELAEIADPVADVEAPLGNEDSVRESDELALAAAELEAVDDAVAGPPLERERDELVPFTGNSELRTDDPLLDRITDDDDDDGVVTVVP